MSKILNIALNLSLVAKIIAWSKRISLPGFDGLPLYSVTYFFARELQKENLTTKAAALAYSFLLAIFPAIIFFFTLIPYLPIPNLQDNLFELLKQILPKSAYEAAQETLYGIIKNQNSGLLSLGFFSALFFSTNGVMALMSAFNKATLQTERRGAIKTRLIAIALTLMLSLLLLMGVFTIFLGEFIVGFLKKQAIVKDAFSVFMLFSLQWLIIMAIFFFAISLLYFYGPSSSKRFRFISAGSTLATVLALLTSVAFSYYINNFSNYNKLYGSIGTLIVIMLWLFINSLILLIGFELNASIDITKQNLPKPEVPRRRNTIQKAIEPIQNAFSKK